MDFQSEIKKQAESAIAIQGDILESLASGNNPTKQCLDKLKIVNLSFDNFLKIRESLDKFCGEIEVDDYLLKSVGTKEDESIY